jgi:hypothetical protein
MGKYVPIRCASFKENKRKSFFPGGEGPHHANALIRSAERDLWILAPHDEHVLSGQRRWGMGGERRSSRKASAADGSAAGCKLASVECGRLEVVLNGESADRNGPSYSGV